MRRTGFRRANKYKAIKTRVDNIVFDSKLESKWYEWFKWMQEVKMIRDLELQKEVEIKVNGKLICMHYPDFYFYDNTKKTWTFADAKGVETAEFRLKYKLTKALNPKTEYRICKGTPR